jgi:hypothetical protein
MLGQGGVGEASSLCFFPRGQSEDASLTTRSFASSQGLIIPDSEV